MLHSTRSGTDKRQILSLLLTKTFQ
jgi:hypothetical protein